MDDLNARGAAAYALQQVVVRGRSANDVIPKMLSNLPEKDRGFARELFSGSLRWLPKLEWILDQLVDRPLKPKDAIVHTLLLGGLYQLYFMRVPSHAAVNETVNATRQMGHAWAGKFVNATMRNADKRRKELLAKADGRDSSKYAHPSWMVKWLKHAWPENWREVLEANNIPAGITLRARSQFAGREVLQQALTESGVASHAGNLASQALKLEKSGDVTGLPGFAEGHFVVQDEAAQLAAELLAPQAGDRVLDACAAPGGKACHLLDLEPKIAELVALDVEESRQTRVEENLARLSLKANVITGDASAKKWWDGEPFDRILLDAPCSATGVIRRHPDIKLHRRPEDLDSLTLLQADILDNVWEMLKPGGTMLYVTCSVLPKENNAQMRAFLKRQPDARESLIDVAWGLEETHGRQLLPGQHGTDGFYFALVEKLK